MDEIGTGLVNEENLENMQSAQGQLLGIIERLAYLESEKKPLANNSKVSIFDRKFFALEEHQSKLQLRVE